MKLIAFVAGCAGGFFACPLLAQPSGPDAVVEQLLHRLTLEQKIDLIGGESPMNIRAMPEIGLPQLRMSDGPMGIKSWGTSQAYAAGIGLAASWDRDLARQLGQSYGRDARARGVHFLLGPGVNIYRSPLNGRNFEYLGEDPFLAGAMVAPFIIGVQQEGVVATVKHFAANNSEFDRHNTNSIVDERTLREIYLPAFESAVKTGHVGAVMGAYNLLNGHHASESSYLNTEVLRHDWGFRGILMTDWLATYDGVAAANSGLDLEMPTGKFMNRATLLPAIQSGAVSEATIDEKVRHILRLVVQFHFLDRPQLDESIPKFNQPSRAIALQSVQEAIVLLKNEGGLLPLDRSRLHRIAILGPNAHPGALGGGGSSTVTTFESTSPLLGLRDALRGTSAVIDYAKGLKDFQDVAHTTEWSTDAAGAHSGLQQESYLTRDFSGTPQVATVPHVDQWFEDRFNDGSTGTTSRRFRGYFRAKQAGTYTVMANCSRQDAYTLSIDGRQVFDQPSRESQAPHTVELELAAGQSVAVQLDYLPISSRQGMTLGIVANKELIDAEAIAQAAKADAVVIAVGFDFRYEGERFDRTFALPAGQEALIRAVEAVNSRTIVVLNAGGGVDMSRWIAQTPALLHAFYGGQEGGRALGQVLVGEVNPAGHLPISIERQLADNPTTPNYHPAPGETAVTYREGIFLGYRHYDRSATKPLFPFGFGLSYTSFAFSDLQVTPQSAGAPDQVLVSFAVRNTGPRAGGEVAQVYVGDPSAKVERPLRELKGFTRVMLQPGESRRVSVALDRRAFAYWDVTQRNWHIDPGQFTIFVGDSSVHLPLQTGLTLHN